MVLPPTRRLPALKFPENVHHRDLHQLLCRGNRVPPSRSTTRTPPCRDTVRPPARDTATCQGSSPSFFLVFFFIVLSTAARTSLHMIPTSRPPPPPARPRHSPTIGRAAVSTPRRRTIASLSTDHRSAYLATFSPRGNSTICRRYHVLNKIIMMMCSSHKEKYQPAPASSGSLQRQPFYIHSSNLTGYELSLLRK